MALETSQTRSVAPSTECLNFITVEIQASSIFGIYIAHTSDIPESDLSDVALRLRNMANVQLMMKNVWQQQR